MKPGDTFLINLGCGEHLQIVLSYPFGQDCSVIVTMLSTYDADYKNSACILYPTDGHPFIKSISCIAYNLSAVFPQEKLEALAVKMMPPLSEDVLRRVLKGADAGNSAMPNRLWVILDDQKLIPS